MRTTPPYIRSDVLSELPQIQHGFFTRCGGVSKGVYKSLNTAFSSNDDTRNITENRRLIKDALHAQQLITASQIHSAIVHHVTGPWTQAAPEGDALVTATPGLALGVLTADCVPVLFADPIANIIGAAHCGWQGAVKDVLSATIMQIIALGGAIENLRAAVGPAISKDSYEVGADLRTSFLGAYAGADTYFQSGTADGKWQFALDHWVLARLQSLGISRIGFVNRDTYTDEENFFSYRRTTHKKQADFGRQISAIALAP